MAYGSFIDSTYFTGEIFIPGASADAQLTQAIAQYEKEVLLKLLGYPLYKLLIADCTGVGDVPVTQKYIDLVNGAEFTHVYLDESYTLKWEGLKNSAKVSLITYYIYYKFVERHLTEYHGKALTTLPKGKDWEKTNPVFKLSNVWNRMRELYGKVPLGYKNYFIHPVLADDLPDTFNMDPSAYNFLYANKATYTEWIFTPFWNINAFGI